MAFTIGQRIGKVVVIGSSRDSSRKLRLKYYCDCGKVKETDAYGVSKKAINSCGCEKRNNYRHGYTRKGDVSPEWQAWNHMKQRCVNTCDKSYADYGGRGISVCDRWINSFQNFIDDMGPRPHGKTSLGRIDNEGDYSPDNCRWEDHQQQARNKRSTRFVTRNGQTLLLAEWAEITGIKRRTLSARLLDYGWDVDRALSTPLQKNGRAGL